MNLPPRILIFTGNGKGKTTAALGMALRAAGHGMRVAVIQFVKADDTVGELKALHQLSGDLGAIEIHQVGMGFLPPKDHPSLFEHRAAADDGLSLAERFVADRRCDLLILDELCVAVSRGVVEEARVVDLLRRVPDGMTAVLTGRNASPQLIELADTVTEMRLVKHAYAKGRAAQEGVEF